METVSSRHAEPVGYELGEGGLVALAVAVRAGQDLNRADRIDTHFRRFPQADAGAERTDRLRRRNAAGLDVAAHADAAQLAAAFGFRLAGGKAIVVGAFMAASSEAS
jgi:hypothetical protein